MRPSFETAARGLRRMRDCKPPLTPAAAKTGIVSPFGFGADHAAPDDADDCRGLRYRDRGGSRRQQAAAEEPHLSRRLAVAAGPAARRLSLSHDRGAGDAVPRTSARD